MVTGIQRPQIHDMATPLGPKYIPYTWTLWVGGGTQSHKQLRATTDTAVWEEPTNVVHSPGLDRKKILTPRFPLKGSLNGDIGPCGGCIGPHWEYSYAQYPKYLQNELVGFQKGCCLRSFQPQGPRIWGLRASGCLGLSDP